MRILLVQPYADGAGHYGRYSVRLAQEISLAGHDVTLCVNHVDVSQYLDGAPAFDLVTLGEARAFAPAERIRRDSTARWFAARIRNNVAVLRKAAQLAKERSFDIVHLLSYELVSTWATLAATGLGALQPIAIEVSAANFATEKHYGGAAERAWRKLHKKAFQRMLNGPVQAINVNSASHAPELRAQLGLADDFVIEVVQDAREIPAERMTQQQARASLGLPGSPQILLFFGTIRRDKGIETLLEAFRRVRDEDVRLVVAGMPFDVDADELRKRLADDPRIDARLGYVAEGDIDAYFYAADALVLPYAGFYSGSSGPLYDACAHGLPVIASDVSEMGAIVKRLDVGVTSPPDDPAALAQGIARFLALPSKEREAMGARGLDEARRNGRSEVAKRFVAMYGKAIARAKESGP